MFIVFQSNILNNYYLRDLKRNLTIHFISSVKSPIDDRLMDGVSSMRVHASFSYSNSNYSIRLTDIYVIQVSLCLILQ